ncbi:MAG TPA: type II toxin-antitoxin system HicA family toxin [Chthoniobacteraceae bacterium]|nr:type II toxin-antitoxin system HicA family toxin [Chthoniobacteraceae bacterium]
MRSWLACCGLASWLKRQFRSHAVLRHGDGRQTYVAMHTKDLPTGTFRSILKQAKLTEDEFRNL